MISLPRRDIFSQSDSLEHACLPETNSRGRSKQSARLIALVGNEWAPGSLGKQPAAHFPSPCSAGYPGRSREWLRPRLFGGSPRQFSGACRNHHTLFPVVGAQQPPPARRVAPESPGSGPGLFRLSASAALQSPLDWRRASDRSANRSSGRRGDLWSFAPAQDRDKERHTLFQSGQCRAAPTAAWGSSSARMCST